MPGAEEPLSTACVKAAWDLRKSVVLWDLVWEGEANKTGRLEGQLESLPRWIGNVWLGHLPHLTQSCVFSGDGEKGYIWRSISKFWKDVLALGQPGS